MDPVLPIGPQTINKEEKNIKDQKREKIIVKISNFPIFEKNSISPITRKTPAPSVVIAPPRIEIPILVKLYRTF